LFVHQKGVCFSTHMLCTDFTWLQSPKREKKNGDGKKYKMAGKTIFQHLASMSAFFMLDQNNSYA